MAAIGTLTNLTESADNNSKFDKIAESSPKGLKYDWLNGVFTLLSSAHIINVFPGFWQY